MLSPCFSVLSRRAATKFDRDHFCPQPNCRIVRQVIPTGHTGVGGARRREMSDRISWNIGDVEMRRRGARVERHRVGCELDDPQRPAAKRPSHSMGVASRKPPSPRPRAARLATYASS